MISTDDVIRFLDEHYIDTEYYLNEEARALVNKDLMSIEYIDNLSSIEMINFLDISILVIDEIM